MISVPGVTVGWCITSQETADVVELFLSTLRERSPSTLVNVVMTDDGMIKQIICRESSSSSANGRCRCLVFRLSIFP